MPVVITDKEIQASGLSESQFRLELAIVLFEKNIYTLGQAAHFANIPVAVMQNELSKRKIPLHYTLDDLENDYRNILKERDADYK